MKSKNLFPRLFLVLIAASIFNLTSCSLLREDHPEQSPLVGGWHLDRSSSKTTINNEDFVSYLMTNKGITRAEAETIKTDFITTADLPLVRQIGFGSDGVTFYMSIGDAEDYIWGTYISTNNDSKLTLTVDDNGPEWVFNIVELRKREILRLDFPTTVSRDITGDGSLETIGVNLTLEFGNRLLFP